MTHSRGIPLLTHRQFINSRLSCSISFFATNTSQLFNFLAIPGISYWKSLFSQFQFSTQAIFMSQGLICPSTGLKLLKLLSFKFLIDLLKSKVRISLFPISRLNLGVMQFLMSYSLSSDVQLNFPSKDLWRFLLSFNECTTFVSRSPFPFEECEPKKAFLPQNLCPTLPQFAGRQNDPTHDLPSVSRGLRVRTLMELC